jgi:hypothetical protein
MIGKYSSSIETQIEELRIKLDDMEFSSHPVDAAIRLEIVKRTKRLREQQNINLMLPTI